ncbi:MAG: Crp/Fnr family transcriptional regulator [Alloprevotella sp.]
MNLNLSKSNLEDLKKYVIEHGTHRTVGRGEVLVKEGEDNGKMFLIRNGSFKCVRKDSRGHERVLALMFDGELVANYLTTRCGVPSMFDVVALEESTGYEVDLSACSEDFERTVEGTTYVHGFVEALAYSHLCRALSLACLSPWERLDELRSKIPDIFTRVERRVVAAYIGVSSETLSRRLQEVL